mmetsp:Transcript_10642/g.24708  ORF Transcript_10642/g.24708 Transcript_10642/m.24708 type:complete len:150 (-) Transcript_10642:562-1011(-)
MASWLSITLLPSSALAKMPTESGHEYPVWYWVKNHGCMLVFLGGDRHKKQEPVISQELNGQPRNIPTLMRTRYREVSCPLKQTLVSFSLLGDTPVVFTGCAAGGPPRIHPTTTCSIISVDNTIRSVRFTATRAHSLLRVLFGFSKVLFS